MMASCYCFANQLLLESLRWTVSAMHLSSAILVRKVIQFFRQVALSNSRRTRFRQHPRRERVIVSAFIVVWHQLR